MRVIFHNNIPVDDELEKQIQEEVMNNKNDYAKKHLKYKKSKNLLVITCKISICKFMIRYIKSKNARFWQNTHNNKIHQHTKCTNFTQIDNEIIAKTAVQDIRMNSNEIATLIVSSTNPFQPKDLKFEQSIYNLNQKVLEQQIQSQQYQLQQQQNQQQLQQQQQLQKEFHQQQQLFQLVLEQQQQIFNQKVEQQNEKIEALAKKITELETFPFLLSASKNIITVPTDGYCGYNAVTIAIYHTLAKKNYLINSMLLQLNNNQKLYEKLK